MENLHETKSANQILNDAADFLEQSDRWHKGTFFKANESNPDQGCSMCAHGAIMYCSSDFVKEKADKNYVVTAHETNAARVGAAAAAASDIPDAYYQNLAYKEGLSLQEFLLKHYREVSAAHYKAFRVGLSYSYNDDPRTTKQDIIDKLREAANII